jgi:hypothetical protein
LESRKVHLAITAFKMEQKSLQEPGQKPALRPTPWG